MSDSEDKISSFDARLKKIQDAHQQIPEQDPKNKELSGGTRAFQMGIELLAAICLGTFMGYGIDRWLDTTPFAMIIFFLLGVAAGFLNLYRFVKGLGYTVGYRSDDQ